MFVSFNGICFFSFLSNDEIWIFMKDIFTWKLLINVLFVMLFLDISRELKYFHPFGFCENLFQWNESREHILVSL